MLKDDVMRYYLEQDMNCSESLSRGANDHYALGLSEEALRAIGAFGGGCCAGRFCGACAGAAAALAARFNHSRMHAEPAAKEHIGEYVQSFIETLGSDICAELKEKYFDETLDRARCRRTVETAADLLEEKMNKYLSQEES